MEVNVAQLMKSSIGAERNYEVDESHNIEGEEVQVRGEVKLVRTDRGILATGSLVAILTIDCSRCLQPYKCPVKIQFDEEYLPTIDVISGLPLTEPEAQPGYFTISDHHIVNLSEAIKQYAVLAKPMKPLCHAECPGLCPHCGHDLKLGLCECKKTETNPYSAKLKDVLKEEK